MENEVWLPIKGFEGIYQISNLGRLKRLSKITIVEKSCGLKYMYPFKEMIVKSGFDKNGYLICSLTKDKKYFAKKIHRLLMQMFKPNEYSEDLQVNHINGIKNDNRLENLEMVTCSENLKHKYRVLKYVRYKKGTNRLGSSIRVSQVDPSNMSVVREFNSLKEAGESIGGKQASNQISKFLRGKLTHVRGFLWKYTDGENEFLKKKQLKLKEMEKEKQRGFQLKNSQLKIA